MILFVLEIVYIQPSVNVETFRLEMYFEHKHQIAFLKTLPIQEMNGEKIAIKIPLSKYKSTTWKHSRQQRQQEQQQQPQNITRILSLIEAIFSKAANKKKKHTLELEMFTKGQMSLMFEYLDAIERS